MKKFLAFLKWHWDSYHFTQKLWITGGLFFGWGVPNYITTGEPNLALRIGVTLWVLMLLKWFVWDMIAQSWTRFEQERKDLFKTIDEGK